MVYVLLGCVLLYFAISYIRHLKENIIEYYVVFFRFATVELLSTSNVRRKYVTFRQQEGKGQQEDNQ